MNTFESYDTRDRVKRIKDYLAVARSLDLKIDETFQTMIREGQKLLEMTDQQIGDAITVSRPTVNRWVNGKNLPYNAMRKPVLNWIEGELSKKIKILESFAFPIPVPIARESSVAYPLAAAKRR